MTAAHYSARTAAEFERVSAENGHVTIAGLTDEQRKASPSKWGLGHLLAYRLLISDDKAFLPSLEEDHKGRCPVCVDQGHGSDGGSESDKQDSATQKIDWTYAKPIIGAKFSPNALQMATESSLLRDHGAGGLFWLSLARASRSSVSESAKVHPTRHRAAVVKEGYINTVDAIQGSSSPAKSSGSEFDYSFGTESIDPDEHEARQDKPEEVTVQLIMSFLQYVLQLCLLQDAQSAVEIRPRIERRRSALPGRGPGIVTAEDDGGICRMFRTQQGWELGHPYLALIEAKRAFKSFEEDPDTGRLRPKASNRTLAQYLGEAIATWSSSRLLMGNNVFMIAATNTYVQFIHFEIGSHYHAYLSAADSISRSAAVNDQTDDTFIRMQCTKWFNLQAPEGRRIAMCHVLAILRFHDMNGSAQPSAETSFDSNPPGVDLDHPMSSSFSESVEEHDESDLSMDSRD